MEKYKLQGMHCANCAKKMEAKLQALPQGEKIHISFRDSVLYVPETVDIKAVKKVVGFDKVLLDSFSESDHHNARHQSEKHSHGHHHHHHASKCATTTNQTNERKPEMKFFSEN